MTEQADRPGSLGYVVVPCPRCGEPRRVEVLGEVGPVKRDGWFELRMEIAGEKVGVCYARLRAGRADDHDCPRRKRRPLARTA